jgi:hypothetical protein
MISGLDGGVIPLDGSSTRPPAVPRFLGDGRDEGGREGGRGGKEEEEEELWETRGMSWSLARRIARRRDAPPDTLRNCRNKRSLLS